MRWGASARRALVGLALARVLTRSSSSSAFAAATSASTTPVLVPRHARKLAHDSGALFFGSCFGENVVEALARLKFQSIESNPQGISFNPVSLSLQLSNAVSGKVWTETDLLATGLNGEISVSLQHHTRFTALTRDRAAMLQEMNARSARAHACLHRAQFVFLTLGSAKVHSLRSTGAVVSNCHKLPSELFDSRMLGVDEVLSALGPAIEALLSSRASSPPSVVLTVSPIRHTREGMQNNALSKAVLRVACAELVSKFPSAVTYFPSFEIVTDELRDYRYYSQDLIHPSPAAVEVVFDRFAQSFMSDETRSLCSEVEKILSDAQHRVTPALACSQQYQQHLRSTLAKIDAFEAKHALPAEGGWDFAQERKRLRALLA